MKAFAISLGLALAVAGCTVQSEEDQLEEAIRNNLSSQGNVLRVEMTKVDDNNINGFADIRENSGSEGRLTCTAQRSEGSNFNWRCSPAVTEDMVRNMENLIRTNLSGQTEVLEVDMSRVDDNRMSGFARFRDQSGSEQRADCVATRQTGNQFNWECNQGGAAAGQGQEGGETGNGGK